jgi:hypothetical protein
MLHRVALLWTNISEESSIVFLRSVRPLLVTANVVHRSLIVVILMMKALSSTEMSFIQDLIDVTS